VALHASVAPRTARPEPGPLARWAERFSYIHVDLGSGDGKYAVQVARTHPETAVIGLDTCLDHLRGAGKRQPPNVRFMTHDACGWPLGLLPAANVVTANFPYGSLLRGLVEGDSALLTRIDALLARGGRLEARVNASALVAGGLDPETGSAAIAAALRRAIGLQVAIRALSQADLRAFPTTWAKRLGYGRPTSAWLIEAHRR